MSEQLSQKSPGAASSFAEDASTQPITRPVVVVEDEDEGGDSDADALRRRRRRRRKRSLKADNPERRIRTILLGVVIVLLILALTGAQVGTWAKEMLSSAKSSGQLHGIGEIARKFVRWDVIALLIAAVVLLYLQPGVEEKVLRALGIKKDRRR